MIPLSRRTSAKNQAARAKVVSWVVLNHFERVGDETVSHVANVDSAIQEAIEHMH